MRTGKSGGDRWPFRPSYPAARSSRQCSPCNPYAATSGAFGVSNYGEIWSLFGGSSCMKIVGNYKAFASLVRLATIGAAILAKKLQAQDEKSESLKEDVAGSYPNIFPYFRTCRPYSHRWTLRALFLRKPGSKRKKRWNRSEEKACTRQLAAFLFTPLKVIRI